jgi:endo-1,4-beta-xylanase
MDNCLIKIKNVFVFLIVLSTMMYSCKKENTDNVKEYYSPESLAGSASFPIGTAYDPALGVNDFVYGSIVNSQFNSITSENDFKMYVIWPNGPGTDFNFTKADEVFEFAKQNNKRMHGHVLSWYFYEQTCSWISGFTGSNAEFETIYKNYVQTVVARYKGKLSSWDVVNEAVDDISPISGSISLPANGFVLRNDYQKRFLGDNFIYKIFKWTEEIDPNTDLFYNDYNLELFPAKLDKVLQLLDDAKRQGAKIDGVGFQAHILFPRIMTYQSYYNAFKKVANRGYKVHVSELDIVINGPLGLKTKPSIQDLEMQKIFYQTYVKAYIDAVPPNLRFGITVWGASDKYSWLKTTAPWPINKIDWPCLYDDSLKPKPACFGFRDELKRSL